MARRLALLLCGVLAATAVPRRTPTWVGGCGAYDPGTGGPASVPTETALVRFGGGAEDVYVSRTVHSTATAGALMFPVPDQHATVKAGCSTTWGLTEPPNGESTEPCAGTAEPKRRHRP